MRARTILGSSHSRRGRRFYSGDGWKRIDAPQEAAPSIAPRRRSSVASSRSRRSESGTPIIMQGLPKRPARTADYQRSAQRSCTIPRGSSNHLPPVPSGRAIAGLQPGLAGLEAAADQQRPRLRHRAANCL